MTIETSLLATVISFIVAIIGVKCVQSDESHKALVCKPKIGCLFFVVGVDSFFVFLTILVVKIFQLL